MGAAIQPQPFGKYFLLERIATGGMAEIYKARYRAEGGFEKTLVIKKILPHLSRDEQFVNMFRDEAALTVRLNHANIVQVFDFGRTGEDYFLAMEYVQGQNLRGVMRRCQELGAPVPISFALFAATEIAKGLAYAHSRRDENDNAMQIVHRDITPSNILVSYEGEFKIADFGIAKAASRASGTQAGTIKGKASYLAPEQVIGNEIDGRADLFALGAVIWEAVVGKKLFSGDSDFEIMNRITSQPIPTPSSRNGAIPPEVEAVIMKCLERDPADRYENASALQQDLAGLLTMFAGDITTVDISSFLRRLFLEEMAAEKEASKSLARAPLPNDAALLHAANDGATLADPRPRPLPRRLAPRGTSALTKFVSFAGLLVLTVCAYAWYLRSLPPETSEFTIASPSGPIAAASAAPSRDPSVAPSAAPSLAPTATAAPIASARVQASPVETVRATASPAPSPRSTRIARATPVSTPRPAQSLTVSVGPTPPPRVDPASIVNGVVKIDSDPWGEIYVDGKDIGRQTPAFDLKLPEGRHEIRLVNSVQNLEARVTVVVDSKSPQKIVVKLTPKP